MFLARLYILAFMYMLQQHLFPPPQYVLPIAYAIGGVKATKVTSFAIALLITPILDSYLLVTGVGWRDFLNRRAVKAALKSVAVMVLISFLIIGPMIGLAILDDYLGGRLHSVNLSWAVIGVFLFVMTGKRIAILMSDREALRKAEQSTSLTRSAIASSFNQLRAEPSRIRYVEWLRDHQIKPDGEWPVERPNLGGSRASTLLAQLDERWMGLDS
jgi:hypothetical protein